MEKYMEDTIKYYDDNKETYYNTWNVEFVNDMKFDVPDIFLSYLPPNAHILDLGCGSGRDSLYFKNKNYRITALDGSKEMCDMTSKLLGEKVRHLNFLDLDYEDEFEGIFACASLLHLNNEDLITVLHKVNRALKNKGILYMSFKYGEGERLKETRYFNDMTEEKFQSICKHIPDFEIIKTWHTDQYGNHKSFLNILIRKVTKHD